MAEFLYRVGRWSARRARTVLVAWLAVLVAAGVAFALGAGTLATTFSIPGTPTAEVTDRLQSDFPDASGGTGTVVVQTEDGEPFTAEQEEAVAGLVAEAAAVDGVTAVMDPFQTEADRAAQAQQVEAGRTQIEDGRAQLDAQQAALDEGLAALDAQQTTLDDGRATLEEQEAQLEQGATLLDMASEIRMVSEDGTAAIVMVSFADPQMEIPQETKDALVDVFADAPEGLQIDLSSDMTMGAPSIIGAGEIVGLLVAAVVLVMMLGTLIGGGLPILTALIGVGIGALGALSLSGVVEMASVTPVLGLMLGLAVGIDYSLFIVNRHRRQLKAGDELHESIALANGTSGNAVVFAGTTVLVALLALNVTGIPFLGLMGTVGALCIAIAVLIAVTLTPALLGLVGLRILSKKERAQLEAGAGTGGEVAAAPAAASAAPLRPMSTGWAVVRVVVGVAALLLVALPALDLRVNLPDGSTEPHDSSQYQAYATLAEKFGEGQNGTLLVVADLPASETEAESMTAQVEIAQVLFDQEDVVAVAPIGTSEDGTVAAFQVVPREGPTSESTEELVHTLRDMSPIDGTYEIGVAGSASGNVDISEKLESALPVYLAVVVGLSLIILVLVFRSIFVPVIATLGFILSYFAALGGVVAKYDRMKPSVAMTGTKIDRNTRTRMMSDRPTTTAR